MLAHTSVDAYIGQRVKERRKTLKLNQNQLAAMLGLSYQQVQKYEKGQSQISVGKLLQLSKILNVNPSYFYDGAKVEDIGKRIDTDAIPKTRTTKLQLLLVEDNPNDVILFKKALGSSSTPVELHIIHDAEMVMDFLHNHDSKYGKPKPDIIILDLSLPRIGGMQLLALIKRNTQTVEIPVIIHTDSISRKEIQEVYRRGAAGFVQKSLEAGEYEQSISTLVHYWSTVVALPGM